MNKIIGGLKRWFEHYGIIKIVISILLYVSTVALFEKYGNMFYYWLSVISGAYLGISIVILVGAGIVNSIKDAFSSKDKKG